MKIQTPNDFIPFQDGNLEVWEVKNNKLNRKVEILAFSESGVGYKKYFVAQAAGVKLERVVQVPFRGYLLGKGFNVVISGTRYKIHQCQWLKGTNPQACQLSLEGLGVIQNGE